MKKGWYYRGVEDGRETLRWIGTNWCYHSEVRTAQEFLKLAKEGFFNKEKDESRWMFRLDVASATVISDREFFIQEEYGWYHFKRGDAVAFKQEDM